MRPTHILYLIDDLYSSRGGSEQHLLWLLRSIPSSEFEKHFVIFSTFWHPETAVLEQEPVVLGEKFGIGGKSWLRRFRFLAKYIREHKIELIQAFSPRAELAAVLAVRLARQGRVIGNRRDCGYDKRRELRWIFWLARLLGTKYVANSEAAKQAAFRNDGTPLHSITVIRNPIAFERIQAGLAAPMRRSDLPITSEFPTGKLVGMVATVRPIKDYGTLICAAKIVLEKFPDTGFLFVGEKDEKHKSELQQLAEEQGVSEKIIWYGGIDNPLKIVPLFDVAVLSSHSESFSNAVLEYAVAERAIVVSDVGGLGEIIEDGRSGFIVPPENPAALAEKIIRFFEDSELGHRFGQQAKEFVFREYNEQKILKQYLEFYRQTLNKH
ncbi:MAG: glycosyltransferase [Planctomycetaceae bacterium]|jgi:glycosyltransferase involved in cell wall biosynthesis|nr:glycosyltransferase [Planctomycetaceae bacterium]